MASSSLNPSRHRQPPTRPSAPKKHHTSVSIVRATSSPESALFVLGIHLTVPRPRPYNPNQHRRV